MFDSLRRRLGWWVHNEKMADAAVEHTLRYLFLEVTRRCNLHCAYCGSDCVEREQPGELTVPEWIEIVRGIARDFTPKDIMVAVTGGEPLLKPGIFDLLAVLHAEGFRFGIVTNGTLMTPANARRIVESRMGSLTISFDGPPDVHDLLRGPGTAVKAVAAARALHEAGYKGKLEFFTTVTKPVLARIDEVRRIAALERVPLWRVAPVMPIGRAALRPDLQLDGADLRALFDYIVRSRADGLTPIPELCEEGYVGDDYEGRVRPYLCQCRAGITTGGIKCTGEIGACPELSPAFDQGHIKRESLKEVWESRYQVFRDRSWTRKGECAACDVYARCKGGAMHLYENPDGDFLRCFHLMCGGKEKKGEG